MHCISHHLEEKGSVEVAAAGAVSSNLLRARSAFPSMRMDWKNTRIFNEDTRQLLDATVLIVETFELRERRRVYLYGFPFALCDARGP